MDPTRNADPYAAFSGQEDADPLTPGQAIRVMSSSLLSSAADDVEWLAGAWLSLLADRLDGVAGRIGQDPDVGRFVREWSRASVGKNYVDAQRIALAWEARREFDHDADEVDPNAAAPIGSVDVPSGLDVFA